MTATPLRKNKPLSELVGTEIWVKHENFQVTGAFKIRGGINLMSRLQECQVRPSGVVAASTGNHGQSIAFASALFSFACTICVPLGANPLKVSAIENLGAEIIQSGRDFDDARELAESVAEERDLRYIHSGNEPDLIAGVATASLEVFTELGDIDVLIVPIGGGSGAAGAALVAQTISPSTRVIGVQSSKAPAAHRSWEQKVLRADRVATIAEGLATRTAFALPQAMLQTTLHDFVLVEDEDILRSTAAMMRETRTLVEPSGAAPLAAAIKLRNRIAEQRVVLMCTGANIAPDQLQQVVGRMVQT